MGAGATFTAAQAVGAGLSYMQLSRSVRRGALLRPWRGVYLTGETTWQERLVAAAAAAGTDAIVSHRAAARLHELWGFEAEVLELTLPRGRTFTREGIRVHQGSVEEDDVGCAGGVSGVTGLARTVIDLAAVTDRHALACAFESGWCRDRELLEQVERRLAICGSRGRRGTKWLHRLMADARQRERPLESPLEIRMWWLMRAWGVPLPQCGIQVDDGEPRKLRFDFFYPDHDLAIETDGYRFHRDYERFLNDCRKNARAAALGIRVMRIADADLDAPELVRERLLAALGRIRRRAVFEPGPWPSPSLDGTVHQVELGGGPGSVG